MVLLALALATSPQPMVAFTARYYFLDSRISHSQVYVCDLHGKHRRQLTHESKDCDCVRWVGNHSVAYIVGQKYLKLLNLETGRVRALFRTSKEYPGIDGEAFRFHRGATHRPRFEAGLDKAGLDSAFEIRGGRLRKVEPVQLPKPPMRTELGSVIWKDRDSVILRKGGQDILVGDAFDEPEGFITAWVYRHELYFLDYKTLSTFGEWYFVEVLRNRKRVELLEGHEVEFDNSRKWAAWVDHRELPEDKSMPNYWVAGAGIKDWRTGKEVELVSGLAWATSISLRPDAP